MSNLFNIKKNNIFFYQYNFVHFCYFCLSIFGEIFLPSSNNFYQKFFFSFNIFLNTPFNKKKQKKIITCNNDEGLPNLFVSLVFLLLRNSGSETFLCNTKNLWVIFFYVLKVDKFMELFICNFWSLRGFSRVKGNW